MYLTRVDGSSLDFHTFSIPPANERGQALQEFQWAHHEMGGAIAVRGCQLQHDLAGPGAAEPFVAEGRPRDSAAQPFDLLALLG